ncbi:hypothetical protein RN001_008604 [Aquatica leii]|uniref:Uncharacterized protein n=1 Tax=Aquatica leii TaxID=1421715 RepID=A0AAN7QJ41_9COLE|nr:hypothetical protein RN001_008604 [Aquatica leii]
MPKKKRTRQPKKLQRNEYVEDVEMRSYVEESSITIEIDNFIPNTNVTQPPILDTSYKVDVAIRNTTEMCTWIVSKIKQYHTQYFSQVLTKVIAWSGVIVNQGLAQLYQLCSKQNGNVQNDHKYKEIIDELNRIRHEVLEFRKEFKNYREDNRRYVSTQMIPPPPPPPPPPPISLPNIPLACKPDLKQQKKADITKPIISLDDILKVKLKKVNDRTSMRRATEPIILPSLRKNLKAVAPAKSLKDIESNSPCSALTRI